MKKFSMAAAFLVLAALPALARGPECRWAHSWDEAVAEAKERNVPIHATFHKDN